MSFFLRLRMLCSNWARRTAQSTPPGSVWSSGLGLDQWLDPKSSPVQWISVAICSERPRAPWALVRCLIGTTGTKKRPRVRRQVGILAAIAPWRRKQVGCFDGLGRRGGGFGWKGVAGVAMQLFWVSLVFLFRGGLDLVGLTRR